LAIGNIAKTFPLNPNTWIHDGSKYIQDHSTLIGLSVLAELALACTLALTTHLIMTRLRDESASLTVGSLWFESFREDRPKGATPWVHAKLIDGTSFYGLLRSYTAGGKVDEREISIEGVGLTQVEPPWRPGRKGIKSQIGEKWEVVIIRAPQIAYLRLYYRSNATGQVALSARRRSAMERDGLLPSSTITGRRRQ
jgi:hypothetical protein